jgi:hypothetical protein
VNLCKDAQPGEQTTPYYRQSTHGHPSSPESCPTGCNRKTFRHSTSRRTSSPDHGNDDGRLDPVRSDHSTRPAQATAPNPLAPLIRCGGYGDATRRVCNLRNHDHRPLMAAFMEYIREQVAQFSEGVSQRMILRQNYISIPASTSISEGRRSVPHHPTLAVTPLDMKSKCPDSSGLVDKLIDRFASGLSCTSRL